MASCDRRATFDWAACWDSAAEASPPLLRVPKWAATPARQRPNPFKDAAQVPFANAAQQDLQVPVCTPAAAAVTALQGGFPLT